MANEGVAVRGTSYADEAGVGDQADMAVAPPSEPKATRDGKETLKPVGGRSVQGGAFASATGASGGPSAPPPGRMLWMAAVGDIMLDRTVGKRIKANGARSILEVVRRQIRAPNLTFGNLECPLSTEGPHDPPNCCFRADPKTVDVLTGGGFDVVSLANNHTLNAGRVGVMQTLDTLSANNIAYVGARKERDRSWEPIYFEVGSMTVGFLAYTDLSFDHGSYTKIDKDPQEAHDQVARTSAKCDLLFVSVHWGEEYEKEPRQRQKSTAHALIDAGADCILGHHPHTLQGIGVYKGRPILYSMGNFVFDQREGERMESAIFEMWWKEGGQWQIKATPIRIDRERMGPIYPSPERSLKIAGRLRDISRGLGTQVGMDGSRVLVRIPQPPPPEMKKGAAPGKPH